MTASRAVDIERAEGLVDRASAASPRSPVVHYAKGQVLRAQLRYEQAIPEYETVISFNGNSVDAISALADCKLHVGPIEEVIPLQEQALRLSPRDPLISNMFSRIGVVHLLQSRTDEAIVWFEKARNANPARPIVHAHLASACALKGEAQRAAAELAEARRLSSDDRYSSTAHLSAVQDFGVPKIRAIVEKTYLAGLRKAGLPEE
jgi:tetratricopeptide (TPR) repeat protein